MSKFKAEIQSYRRTYRGGKLPEIKRALSKADYADFVAAMKDPGVPNVAIQRALEKLGVKVSSGCISMMRRNFNG